MIITDKDFDAIAYLGVQESQEIASVEEFSDALGEYCEQGAVLHGTKLPWFRTETACRLRPGELSIWAGINGHGKSELLGQVMLWCLPHESVLIASLEMRPVETLYRMARQARGEKPNRDYSREWSEKLSGRLWIYDQLDSVEQDRILGMTHYAATELKCNHIVIDSLSKCGIGREAYEDQARFVDRLQWCAKAHRVHIHLVCHMRKGQDENHKPNKFDLRGAGEIADFADNVFIVWRNKRKEQAKEAQSLGAGLSKSQSEALDEPDTYLTLAKNRHLGTEASWGLWFNHQSHQWTDSRNQYRMEWAA